MLKEDEEKKNQRLGHAEPLFYSPGKIIIGLLLLFIGPYFSQTTGCELRLRPVPFSN
jgi:hypothetical protein